ncbi:MAG: enoyl-CoA hydratase-related protein [Bradymonadia bacterium]|jgi:enoyl-CoA hydratase/carnithine racemase
MSAPEHVVLETEGAVRTIRFARPEKKNAFTVPMYERIVAGMHAASADPAVRVLRFIGQPGVYTAGNDLVDFMQAPFDDQSPVVQLLRLLVGFDKPMVAAVDGPAIGLGTTMLLHCDFVVATHRARFQMPFINLGLVPEGGSSLLLPAVAGLQRASEWLMLGEAFNAEAAREGGLVNRVVDPDALEATSMDYAQRLAARPAEALRLTRQMLRAPQRDALAAVVESEARIFADRLRSAEAMEAFGAFFNRKA